VQGRGLARVAVPELVEPRVVEAQRAVASVGFEREVAGTAGRHPADLEDADGAAAEADERCRGLVHVDGPLGPGGWVRALAREGSRLSRHGADAVDHPLAEVEQVTAQVGDRAGAARALEAPVERHFRIEELVGEPDRPPGQRLADSALVDHPLHQSDRGQPPVVEADRVEDACPRRRAGRARNLLVLDSERLLAQDRLPGLGGGLDDRGVASRRRADVDDIDVGTVDQRAPVRVRLRDPAGLRGAGESPRVPPAHRHEARPAGKIAEPGRRRPAVSVGTGDPAVADDADPDLRPQVAHLAGASSGFVSILARAWSNHSAAASAATASAAPAPRAAPSSRESAKASAWAASAVRKARSASAPHMNGQRSYARSQVSSSQQQSPGSNLRPSVITRPAPPESRATATAASGSPGSAVGGPAGRAASASLSWPSSQRAWSSSCTPMSIAMPPLVARYSGDGGHSSHWWQERSSGTPSSPLARRERSCSSSGTKRRQ